MLSIYKKSGGKGGTHSWAPTLQLITAASYLAVQIFEHFNGRTFRSVPLALASLQIKQFTLLDSTHFLIVTDEPPVETGPNVNVSAVDAARFSKLAALETNISSAIKTMKTRVQGEPTDEVPAF